MCRHYELDVSKIGNTSGVYHTRGVVWDTPVANWAGESSDWVQEVTMYPPKNDEVIVALLKMT